MRRGHPRDTPESIGYHEPLEITMKALAIIAGLVFLALAVCGLMGYVAMPMMYSAVLGIAGVVFLTYGASHRRALVPLRGTGPDMRDLV
jgi:hypothetical protein